MNFKEYKELAARTCPDLGSVKANYSHMLSGIVTEFGELVDVYKKNHAYGKAIDHVNVAEEWADGMWYFANLSRMYSGYLHFTESNEEMREVTILFDTDKLAGLLLFASSLGDAIRRVDFSEAFNFWLTIGKQLSIDTEKALENNINKLKVRFPDKFDADRALNRTLDAERIELEK